MLYVLLRMHVPAGQVLQPCLPLSCLWFADPVCVSPLPPDGYLYCTVFLHGYCFLFLPLFLASGWFVPSALLYLLAFDHPAALFLHDEPPRPIIEPSPLLPCHRNNFTQSARMAAVLPASQPLYSKSSNNDCSAAARVASSVTMRLLHPSYIYILPNMRPSCALSSFKMLVLDHHRRGSSKLAAFWASILPRRHARSCNADQAHARAAGAVTFPSRHGVLRLACTCPPTTRSPQEAVWLLPARLCSESLLPSPRLIM